MALPLPSLSWTKRGPQSTGQTAPTAQQVIDAFDTLLGTCTHWTKVSKAADHIEVRAAAGGPIPNFKFIMGIDPGAGDYQLPHNAQADALYVGIGPDGGTLTTWNTSDPFSGNRFSKYWQCCQFNVIESIHLVESAEVLAVFFRDDSVVNKFWGFILGAMWEGADAGSVEADDRIYGMAVSGKTSIDVNFWNATGQFMSDSNNVTNDLIGGFKPTAPTQFERFDKAYTTVVTDSQFSGVSLGASLVNLPMYYVSKATASDYYVGVLRQMRIGQEFANMTVLNSGAVQKAIVFSPVVGPSTGDCLMFCED